MVPARPKPLISFDADRSYGFKVSTAGCTYSMLISLIYPMMRGDAAANCDDAPGAVQWTLGTLAGRGIEAR